jgi:glutathione S-transferase
MGQTLPMAKSPIIEDDGQCIVESGAIIEYLTQIKAGGRLAHGPDSPHFAEYQQWMHFVEGSMMPPLVYDLISAATGTDNEGLTGFIQGEADTAFAHAEQRLARHDYLVADAFSAADVNISFALEFGEARGRLGGYPALQAYLARLQDRPAYKAARAKGGNYDLSIFGAGVADR